MKRSLLLCLLAAAGTLAGVAKTVYFERPAGVSQTTTINKYAWTGSTNIYGAWPGTAIAGTTATLSGKSYIKEEIDDNAENLIFNWDGGQTTDLEVVNNGVYSKDGQIGTASGNTFVPLQTEAIRYYYENTGNWDQVWIYAFNPETFSGWPGKNITDQKETLRDGKEYYYVEVITPLKNIIFNNGNNGSQTGNIVGSDVVAGGVYNASGYTNMTSEDIQEPFEGTELYFLNDLNWKTVYAYAWSGSGDNVTLYNGEWPGQAVTTTTMVNDQEVFVVDFPGAENIIFSCFDDSHNHEAAYDWEQTKDLAYTPGLTYKATTAVKDLKPEKLYVIGGGTGWNINSEEVVLTADADDSYIYTGDVKVTGQEFRIYTNHDGNWNTGSYGSGAPENSAVNITFTAGSAHCKAVKDNKGNWKLPMEYADPENTKIVKFTFNYLDGTFVIYDPSVITVKDLLYSESENRADAVSPAVGTYDDKAAFVAAGDNDGLATVNITLEPGVHINRECASPAILYNNGKKIFEVSAQATLEEIMALNHIGVRCINGNSFDGGTDGPSTFQVVFTTDAEDVLVFQGENELRFPDGFFMLGGEREIKTAVVNDEEIEYESWTGGTPVKGGNFLWNVVNADRPAVEPITHNEGVEDNFTPTSAGTLTVNVAKYGSHEHYPHVTVSEVYGDAQHDLTFPRGTSSFAFYDLLPGRLHAISYHFHADDSADTVDKENWVRDHNGQVCENTVYALTQPTGVVCDLGAQTISLLAGKGTVILYTLDGSAPDTNLLQGIATHSENSTYIHEVTENDPVIDFSDKDVPENPQVALVAAAANPETGEYVVNPSVQDIETSVAAIEAAADGAQYFNLQGVRVEKPANGIFIRVSNGKAMKVTVK